MSAQQTFQRSQHTCSLCLSLIALHSPAPPCAEHQEGLQILHYHDGEKYEPHHDFFHDKVNQQPDHGGQRVVTILMYL